MIKAGSTAFNLIMRYARKRLAAPNAEGIMEVMSNKQAMDFVKDLVNEFNRFGVPESAITKVDDVGKFANQIVDIKQQRLMQEFKKQMTPKKSADIIELQTGKKIDQSKGIMGGRQIEETEDQIKARIEKQNKETIARIKMIDDAIDDAAEGFVMGDNKYNAELVAENLAQRRGLVYDDLSTRERAKIYGEAFDALSKKFRDDLAVGGRAGFSEGTKKKEAPSIVLNPDERKMEKVFETNDPEEAAKEILKRLIRIEGAQIPISEKGILNIAMPKLDTVGVGGGINLLGGELEFGGMKDFGTGEKNVGFKFRKKFSKGSKGSMSRRKFLQMLGGLAALPVVGKFFKGAKVASKAAPVIEKTTSSPPSYFFDLVNKIKILGDEGKSISPRTKTYNYKNYELQENLSTGDIVVIKQKGDPDFAYEEEVLSFRKGQADETTKGKTPPDEYEELTIRPDMDGKMKDVEEGIEPEGIKEILEELDVGGGNLDELTLQEIKRGKLASGGIARMLGE